MVVKVTNSVKKEISREGQQQCEPQGEALVGVSAKPTNQLKFNREILNMREP